MAKQGFGGIGGGRFVPPKRRGGKGDFVADAFSMREIGRLFGPKIMNRAQRARSLGQDFSNIPAALMNDVQKDWWLRGFSNPRHAMWEFTRWYGMNPERLRSARSTGEGFQFMPFRENL